MVRKSLGEWRWSDDLGMRYNETTLTQKTESKHPVWDADEGLKDIVSLYDSFIDFNMSSNVFD